MTVTHPERPCQKIKLHSVDEAFKVDSWQRLTEEVESSFRELRFENGFCLWMLAHLDYAVVWGTATWNGSDGLKWNLDPEYEMGLSVGSLQQLRLFGQVGEMFIWRESFENEMPLFRSRLVWDMDSGAAEKVPLHPYIDETWALWGTDLTKRIPTPGGETWSRISEERGMKLWLPISPDEIKFVETRNGLNNTDPRVLVKVRKYFDFDDSTDLAYTYLTRLVDLVWPLEQERPYTPLKST